MKSPGPAQLCGLSRGGERIAAPGRLALALLTALLLIALAAGVPSGGATPGGGALQAASYSAVPIIGGLESSHEVIVPLVLRSYPLVPGSTWSTTVVIQNAGDASATLTLDYRGRAGDVVLSLDDTLPPWGSQSYDQAAMASLGESFVGSLVITSTQSLAAVVYAHEPTWGDGLVSFAPRREGSTVLYTSYAFNDFFGWTSRLAVASTGDLAADVTIEFYSQTGDLLATHSDTLAGHGSAVYDPGTVAGLPSGLDGNSMAVIRSDRPLVGVAVHLHGGSATARGSSLPGGPEASIYLPGLVKAYSEYVATSGFSLWNLGTGEATVTAAFYSAAGQGVNADVSSIPPGVQRSTYLGADPSLPDGFIGSAVITSDEPLVAGASMVLNLPAASMACSGISRTASTLYAPSLRRSPMVYTTLTVQNAASEAVSVMLSYYDQGGALVARQSDALPAYTSHVYDQSQISGLGEDFVGSAVMSAGGPVAAVVEEYRQPVGGSLTPTPTVTPTPEATPTVGPGAEYVFFPLVTKAWPPIPARPVLHDISIDCNDNDYLVAWDAVARGVSYTLQEDDHPDFPSPTTVYQGASTSYYLYGKAEGTYYYRVRASNEWGDGPWSEVKSVTVGPPMTLWTIDNDTGGDLTIDIHGVGRRTFPTGEHTWCVPSGEHTFTARGGCGSVTDTVEFEPYGSVSHRFWCGSGQELMTRFTMQNETSYSLALDLSPAPSRL